MAGTAGTSGTASTAGLTSEQKARQDIDAALAAAGWAVQDARSPNLLAARCVALREFPLKKGYGFADYLLYLVPTAGTPYPLLLLYGSAPAQTGSGRAPIPDSA